MAVWLTVLAWPSVVITRWLADRDRIARELCELRELPAEMNTCNGQCHLARQLKQAEQQAERSAQEPRVELLETLAEPFSEGLVMVLHPEQRRFPDLREEPLSGHSGRIDPVPRG